MDEFSLMQFFSPARQSYLFHQDYLSATIATIRPRCRNLNVGVALLNQSGGGFLGVQVDLPGPSRHGNDAAVRGQTDFDLDEVCKHDFEQGDLLLPLYEV